MNTRSNTGASAAALATIAGDGAASGSGLGRKTGVKKEEDDDGQGLFGSDDEDGGGRRGDKVSLLLPLLHLAILIVG